MREIRFRAWNSVDMKPVLELRLDRKHGPVANIDRKLYLYFGEEGQNPEWSLMQYTGLKDKNGVEIYEGDIVIVKSPSANEAVTGVVEWQDETTGYAVIAPNPFWPGRQIKRSLYRSNIEAIGNIYENPELLKSNEE